MAKKVHVVTKALVVIDVKTYYQIFVILQGVNTTWVWASCSNRIYKKDKYLMGQGCPDCFHKK